MTYIIAELGSVHDGSLGNALRLIEECAKLGADAVKLQDHRGEKVKGDPPWFRGDLEERGSYLRRTSFDRAQWCIILDECERLKVDLVVSPFSVDAVSLLEQSKSLSGKGVDAYKIASGQVTNLPMLEAVGRTRRPVYLSSGMTSWDEVMAAETACGGAHAILQCTSEYVCAPERVGLNQVKDLANERVGRVGLSDHTIGFAASLAAIALGATVVERHVCFDRRGYGTDCAHSLTLDEFGRFVKEVRALDIMLASPVDKDALVNTPEMQKMRECFLERP